VEEWGFIPPDQLNRLKLMLDSDTNHDYFVDGSPVAYERWDVALDDTDSDGFESPFESFKLLFFGERRGGEYYYALDISDPRTPTLLYKIGPLYLSDTDNDGVADLSGADLGQSWVKPEMRTLFVENDPNLTSDNVTADVFLLAGGYDTNQDNEGAALAATDTVGRAVFAIEVETGNLPDLNNDNQDDLNFNGYNDSDNHKFNYDAMTHSIIDISGFDTDGNGYMNAVYAGDLGGHLFAFRDSEPGKKNPSNNNWPYAYDGVWEARKLFEITNPYDHDGDGGAATPALNLGLKFMYAPDAVRELFDGVPGEYVYIGTGDRTHPSNTDFTDALYAIQNPWASATKTTPLTVGDLYDATDNLIQDAVGADAEETKALREAEKTTLEGKDGWFIRLENAGEKIVSTPRVYAGVVYFTTYEPPTTAPSSNDPCVVPTARGTARLYAVDYKTGGAVHQFDQTNTELNKNDRSVIIGTSVPSAPVIAVHESGAKIFIGVQGGVKSMSPTATNEINLYYWRQLF
jgi:type IV pilus assembly protein PilY1